MSVADTQLLAGNTTQVTFVFSEAVSKFGLEDIKLSNGELSAPSTLDGGITWTATLTPATNVVAPANLITVDNAGFNNAAGNAGAGQTSSENFAIDTVRPTVTVAMSDTALRIGDTALVTFTFSEKVTGFDQSDIILRHGSVTAPVTTDGGLTWTATFTPGTNVEETLDQLMVANSGYSNAAGNSGQELSSFSRSTPYVPPRP